MFEQLANLRSSALAPRELCARFLLLHLCRLHGAEWLSSPRRRIASGARHKFIDEFELGLRAKQKLKLAPLSSATEIFRHFYFRGVVLDAHEGFVGWSEDRYPLTLIRHIPSAEEMLEIQCAGRRYATLLLKDDEQLTAYGRHKNAAAFLLHDFEHAHKFFGLETHSAQVRFFKLLRMNLSYLQEWLDDERFIQDLNYLKSDMNSHPVHLLKYLKAIVLSAAMRKTESRDPALEEFWRAFFSAWKMSKEEVDSAMNLNQPGLESVKDQVRAHDFFARDIRGQN